jgi:hypothetical protein
MAPEQALGKAKEVGPAADVYAPGAILYELLTGRPPFLAASVLETLEQVRTQEPVPPRHLQPSVPGDLETICLKCLHKEPARRYDSAAALADDLARFRADRPIAARPAGPLERGVRWCRRNPAVAAMTAGVVALLVLAAAGATVAAVWLDGERNRAVQAEREKTDKLWHSDVDRARAGRTSGRVGQRLAGLEALTEAARIRFDPVLRDEAIACLALPDIHVVEDRELPAGTAGVCWDDDRRHYALWDERGTVRVCRSADDAELARLTGRAPDTAVSFSPDGSSVGVVWGAAGMTRQGVFWRLDGPGPGDGPPARAPGSVRRGSPPGSSAATAGACSSATATAR